MVWGSRYPPYSPELVRGVADLCWRVGVDTPAIIATKTIGGDAMPSMRAIANKLGISPAYLSYMVSGKRPWNADLHTRYLQLVNTLDQPVNSFGGIINTKSSERLLYTQEAAGSSPALPTTFYTL